MNNFLWISLYILFSVLIVGWAAYCKMKRWNEKRARKRKKRLIKNIRKAIDSGDENPVYEKILEDYDKFGDIDAALKANPLTKDEIAFLLSDKKKVAADALGFWKILKVISGCIAIIPAAGAAYIGFMNKKDSLKLLITIIVVYQIAYTVVLVSLQLLMEHRRKAGELDNGI